MFSIGANISRKIINIKKKEITKEEFVDLIQDNKVSLYRFAKSILKNDTEVEDAISEAILKAYKNKDKLRDKESFKPWIMRIVSNESYNLIRKNSRLELVDNINSLNLVYTDKRYSSLREIVGDLSEEFSSVIVLFYYEDMSIKDISKVLEISEGTVKSRLYRAKEKLKVLLKEEV
ncbi:RNA polymerase sigma factor [Faecalimicrobium sp. JNUCC 81]